MAYVKTTWVDNTTPEIDDDNLNKMENGIFTADANATTAATNIGTIGNLTTTATNLVGAVNEVNANADTATTNIGTIGNLTTTATNLVGAVNEVNAKTVQKGCLLNIASDLATIHDTDKIIEWTTETLDTSGFFVSTNNTQIVIPAECNGCMVILTANIRWDVNATGGRFASIRKNGVTEAASDIAAAALYNRGYTNITKVFFNVATNDYFDVLVRQRSTTTLNITSDARTYFQLAVLK